MFDEDCPGCTRKEFDLNPEAVAALVDQIPISAELKADDDVMEKRLKLCLACEALRGGVLCTFCGCFIRFRVRPRKAYCPHPSGDRWQTPQGQIRGGQT